MALLSKTELERMLGREVAPEHILVSKNMIQGSAQSVIADLLGCTVGEIQEIQASEDFKEVHLLISVKTNESRLQTAELIDDIEMKAWANISKRLEMEKDIEVSMKIAALANRAIRRVAPATEILDPSRAEAKTVRISLSERIVKSLQDGQIAEGRERSITMQGQGMNPSFKQIEEFMNPRDSAIPEDVSPKRDESLDMERFLGVLRAD